MPSDPEWAGGSLLVDETSAASAAPPAAVFATVSGIGGERGWYVTPLLWGVRGWIDKLVGGVGMRRGRRHPDRLWVGDALDFWRVEAVEPDRLLRLQAEMKLPGRAWPEWRVEPEGSGTRLSQRAMFYPRGLTGRAYWYALIPFHALIFARMARRIAAAADNSPNATEGSDCPGSLERSHCGPGRIRTSVGDAGRFTVVRAFDGVPVHGVAGGDGRMPYEIG
ncbi:MAG TPA: DUF2867 domain-containing protein [Acidimicrobiales bacterium]|nr:DUF2867 domain-containing protein [Acidimicrobiales bacterium]